jgi:hypothetical protein
MVVGKLLIKARAYLPSKECVPYLTLLQETENEKKAGPISAKISKAI